MTCNSVGRQVPPAAFVTGLKGFGGLGTFFREPQDYGPFIEGYNSCAGGSHDV
ncbi:hypothetical protein [Streptomyces sp. NBC_00059]|uniref:hypothetical protein n=1 Tax=unclassified Streptomyces TaxID=2593676 RepID=UPI00224DFCA4|nr:hypothetical protein [Streptomyces sp. NBC_00059]MCX5415952.1 hypothetical protein [Streptomyces sp. NBC_00059]